MYSNEMTAHDHIYQYFYSAKLFQCRIISHKTKPYDWTHDLD